MLLKCCQPNLPLHRTSLFSIWHSLAFPSEDPPPLQISNHQILPILHWKFFSALCFSHSQYACSSPVLHLTIERTAGPHSLPLAITPPPEKWIDGGWVERESHVTQDLKPFKCVSRLGLPLQNTTNWWGLINRNLFSCSSGGWKS